MPTIKNDLSQLSMNQLSELTGMTFRTIKSRLSKVAPCAIDGKTKYYDPSEALPVIYANKSDSEGAGTDGDFKSLTKERTRLTKAQADREELRVRELRGELIPQDVVKIVWTTMKSNAKARIMSIPSKLAPIVSINSDAIENERLLEKECRSALQELSEYDPKQYREINSGESEDMGTTTGPDGESVG